MLNLREKFYSASPAGGDAAGGDAAGEDAVLGADAAGGPDDTVEPDITVLSSQEYDKILEQLRKAIEANDETNINFYESQIQTELEKYYKIISDTQENILKEENNVGKVEDIINSEKEKKLLEEGENFLQQKITYLKKYENIKSTELGDKKSITVLVVVNVFVLLLLVYGCYLMLTDKSFDLNFLKDKKSSSRNNKNNNSNSNSLNGLE